jgi:two-component system LytT family response regulator
MPRLRTILVDDEPLALELLRSLLSKIDGVDVFAECRNGYEAIEAISKTEPDLVFLDIHMPGLNGFDVVKSLQPENMPLIVFSTAYDEFALDAFDVHAVDYVLKPPSLERLERSIERVWSRLGQSSDYRDYKSPIIGALDDIARRADELAANDGQNVGLETAEPAAQRLVIRDGGTTHLLDEDNIDWVDAAGDYMCIHCGEDTIIARITMKELVSSLDPDVFARIHRSTIVNLSRVEKVRALAKGESMLTLANGAQLKVSRSYRDSVRKWLRESSTG